jgi:hypothetical protein
MTSTKLLLSGADPTIEDHANFRVACEKLALEELNDMLVTYGSSMNWLLRATGRDVLTRRIQEKNLDRFSDTMLSEMEMLIREADRGS